MQHWTWNLSLIFLAPVPTAIYHRALCFYWVYISYFEVYIFIPLPPKKVRIWLFMFYIAYNLIVDFKLIYYYICKNFLYFFLSFLYCKNSVAAIFALRNSWKYENEIWLNIVNFTMGNFCCKKRQCFKKYSII